MSTARSAPVPHARTAGAHAPAEPASRGRSPFDTSGIVRDERGVAQYADQAGSLVEMLHNSVERDPTAVALVEVRGESLTYRDFWDRAARVAGGLRDAGITRGERVAIRMPNGIDWVLAFFGSQMAGAVVVPMNTRLSDEEARFIIEDSGARFICGRGAALPDGRPLAREDLHRDDLATIFYTSGTTGRPKGAAISHANLLANSENCIRCNGIDRAEGAQRSTLIGVPLFHVTGCNTQLVTVLDLGGRVELLADPLDFEGMLVAVDEHGVAGLVAVPAIYHALLRSPRFAELDVSRVRRLSYGGAPISEGLVREIQAAFPDSSVGNGFGLTECSGVVAFLPHDEAAAHADSVGFAAPAVDLAVPEADPETGVGELLVRGPNVVAGYWNRAEANAETFVDGWLRTGDIGRVDDEGLLYIVDRKKDMINRGGEKVYSLEVENALASAPNVGEVAVVAVPDDMMGEKVGAVIVPLAGRSVDVETILAHCRRHVADFKVPQYVVVRDEPLPRSPVGKVLKGPLRDETHWGTPLR